MEEVWRLCRPGGVVRIRTPHYSGRYAWKDPTHRRAFSSESFHYFGENEYSYYTDARFKVRDVRLMYFLEEEQWPRLHRLLGRGVQALLDAHPTFGERFLCYLVGGIDELRVTRGRQAGVRSRGVARQEEAAQGPHAARRCCSTAAVPHAFPASYLCSGGLGRLAASRLAGPHRLRLYAFWNYRYCALMPHDPVATGWLGLRFQDLRRRRLCLLAALTLSPARYLWYANFAIDGVNQVFMTGGGRLLPGWTSCALGISLHFPHDHHVVDAYAA
jgi:hypothetical protein